MLRREVKATVRFGTAGRIRTELWRTRRTLKGKEKVEAHLSGVRAFQCWCEIILAKSEDLRWNRFTFYSLLHCLLFLHITYNYPKLRTLYIIIHYILVYSSITCYTIYTNVYYYTLYSDTFTCLSPVSSLLQRGGWLLCSLLSLQKLSQASTQ